MTKKYPWNIIFPICSHQSSIIPPLLIKSLFFDCQIIIYPQYIPMKYPRYPIVGYIPFISQLYSLCSQFPYFPNIFSQFPAIFRQFQYFPTSYFLKTLPDFLHLPHIFPELSSILPGRFPLYSFPSFPHGSPPRPGRRPRLPPGRFERHRLRSGAGLGRLGGGLCSAAAGRAQHTGGGEMGWVMLGPWGCLEVVFFTIFFIFCGGVGGFWRICLEVHGIL